jgi:hypothetical protein
MSLCLAGADKTQTSQKSAAGVLSLPLALQRKFKMKFQEMAKLGSREYKRI